MTFSERLIELRKARNLTQKQVYEGIGMSMLGYQRYEYGEREPSYQKLIALADYFDVSLDYLCGRSDNPDINR
jgi:transcriptional regulator with XRE-family HTH domain